MLPSLLALPHRLVGSALTNARRSLEDLNDAVRDRGQLHAESDLDQLSADTCLELLATRSLGRLAYIARAGVPDVVPVNYVLHDGCVVIRSGPGPKLQAAERRERVAFEVDDLDEHSRTGWSVVVSGVAQRLTAVEAAAVEQPDPWAGGPRRHTLVIRPTHLSGRRLG